MRFRSRLTVLALSGLIASCASVRWPVPPPVEHERVVDIVNYDIVVDIDHQAGWVDGSVTVDFAALPDRPADTVLLDAVELEITGIWDDDGNELSWKLVDNLLTIQLDETLAPGEVSAVSVDYNGFPRRGLFMIAPNGTDNDRPWHVWTQGQAVDTRHWVPIWDRPDDRATSRLEITVDPEFVTMAAGELVSSRERRDGRRTDTWQMDVPHVSYLITLVAGGYAVGELNGNGIPLPVLAERQDLPHALENFAETADMLAVFGDVTGVEYPYTKYAQVCVKEYTGGGMENISASTLYYRVIHDPADEPQVSAVGLLGHEAAHQWFGDLITCRDWTDIWLNEGFSDYLENVYFRRSRGDDVGDWRQLRSQRSYLAAELRDSRPIVSARYDHPDDTFTSHVYPGGAARLHLLESILGPDVFSAGLKLYVAHHAAGLVDTNDFKLAMEAASGVDLDLFFDQWLYGPGVPRFRVTLRPGFDSSGDTESDDDTLLYIEQTQTDPLWPRVFELPVSIAWSAGGIEHRARIELNERTEVVVLKGAGPIDWVRFDADTAVPMMLELVQSEAMWRHQLRSADDGVTRLLAAQWLAGNRWVRPGGARRWSPDDATVAALIAAIDDDDFVEVRTTAIAALTRLDGQRLAALEDSSSLFERLLNDHDPRVRQAAADAFGHLDMDTGLNHIYTALDDTNASVVAAALGTLTAWRAPGAFEELSDRYAEAPPERWRLARTCLNLAGQLQDERTLPLLFSAVRTNPEVRVRAAATSGLGRWRGAHQAVVYRNLCELLNDASWSVRAAAAGALGQHGNVAALPALNVRRSIEIDPYVLGAIDRASIRLRGVLAP